MLPTRTSDANTSIAYAALLDGERFLATFNQFPIASVSIVDLEKRRFAAEVAITGCAGIYPIGERRFATLCGDGTDRGGRARRRGPRPRRRALRRASSTRSRTRSRWRACAAGDALGVRRRSRAMCTWSTSRPIRRRRAALVAVRRGRARGQWRVGGLQHLALHARHAVACTRSCTTASAARTRPPGRRSGSTTSRSSERVARFALPELHGRLRRAAVRHRAAARCAPPDAQTGSRATARTRIARHPGRATAAVRAQRRGRRGRRARRAATASTCAISTKRGSPARPWESPDDRPGRRLGRARSRSRGVFAAAALHKWRDLGRFAAALRGPSARSRARWCARSRARSRSPRPRSPPAARSCPRARRAPAAPPPGCSRSTRARSRSTSRAAGARSTAAARRARSRSRGGLLVRNAALVAAALLAVAPASSRALVWVDALSAVGGLRRARARLDRRAVARRSAACRPREVDMIEALLVSNALLWLLVVALAAVVAALARQVGVLHERVAPAGALAIGARARASARPRPRCALPRLSGAAGADRRARDARAASARCSFFVSPTCPVCKTLLADRARASRGRADAGSDSCCERRRARASTRRSCARRGSSRRATCSRASSVCAYQVGEAAVRGADRRGGHRARQGPRQHARARREPVRGRASAASASIQEYLRAPPARATSREDRRRRAMNAIDALVELRRCARLARRSSRRSFLARARRAARRRRRAAAAAGGARRARQRRARRRPTSRIRARRRAIPTSCEYWRHCAIDGFLCELLRRLAASRVRPAPRCRRSTWIGTCRNPADGKDYIISYNDCCGKHVCGLCFCHRNEGDKPIYYPVAQQRHQLVLRHHERRLPLLDGDPCSASRPSRQPER